MKLVFNQVNKIKTLAEAYADLKIIVTKDSIALENPTHIITISHLDILGIQSGIKGYFKALEMLSKKSKRNNRLESAELDEVDYVDVNHIKSNKELRFDCDFEIISHIKTKNKNSKTLLQDSTRNYIFTGDHFDLVIELLSDSPVRYLKRNYPDIYNYLVEIENHRLAKIKEEELRD